MQLMLAGFWKYAAVFVKYVQNIPNNKHNLTHEYKNDLLKDIRGTARLLPLNPPLGAEWKEKTCVHHWQKFFHIGKETLRRH